MKSKLKIQPNKTEAEQKLPPGVPGAAYAESHIKVKLFHIAVAIGASKPIQKIASLFASEKKENKFKLPQYVSDNKL